MHQPTNSRSIIGLNFASMAQHGIILLLVGTIVPNLMETFQIRESLTGLLLSMGALGFIAGPLMAGAVIDRLNVRWALMIGFGIEIATLVMFGLAPSFFIAVAANLVLHLGASFVETTANVMPSLTTSEKTPHSVMNLVHMFFSVGAFLGPFLIGLYVGATGEWRPIMYFALIPTGGLMIWAAATHFPRRRREDAAESPFRHLRGVLKLPHAMLGAATLMLYVGAEVGVSSWVVHYLQKELELSTVASATGLSLLWVFIMVGRYLNSLLGNRYSSHTLVTISGIAGAAGLVAFLFAGSIWSAYLLLGWVGICFAGVFPNVMAELNNRDPEKIGTVTAVMAMGAALGAAVFQWLVGYLAEAVSLRAAFIVPAVLQVAFVITFTAAVRGAGPRRPPSVP